MTDEEARLQRALRDAETDRDNERRRAEVAEGKVRGLENSVRAQEDRADAETARAEEIQERLDEIVDLLPDTGKPEPEYSDYAALVREMRLLWDTERARAKAAPPHPVKVRRAEESPPLPTKTRPIRVFHGLDVYDLPPETRTRRHDSNGYGGPLEERTGEEAVDVEVKPGWFRLVTVEGDALAADRLWSALATAEATIEELRAAPPLVVTPETQAVMTRIAEEVAERPMRQRDTLVWAAAFADFHGRSLAAAYSAADGSPAERMAAAIANVDGAACARVADAAVLAAEGSR